MITENLSTLKIHKLTQEQYERELAAGNIDVNALYLTPDEDIDLSPYATKEDLAAIDYPVDSVNGKKGNVSITLSDFDITATATELNYVDGVIGNIQSQLNGKASSSHNHSASDITYGTLSYDRLPTVPMAKGGTGATDAATARTNLGITPANIGAASSSHTHNYAGSSSAGGAATSANKLNTNAGSTTNPVYFSNGVPVKTTYTLGASVPSGAKFTDTVYTHPSYTAKSSGLYKVTVDSSGHVSSTAAVAKSDITALGIPAQDTTYSAAGSSLGLVKSGGDVSISGGVITVNDNSHNHTFANLTLTSDNYGTSLPSSAPAGKIFFKKV